MTGLLVAVLLSTIVVASPRVSGATGDFTVTMSPSSVTIPSGYWADPLLTVTSLNGMTGAVQINVPVGGTTGLYGAGFSTGMTLPSDGNVSVVIMLTPGPNDGNFTVPVSVTVGSVVHTLPVPVTIAPVTNPDFITRLWGSYSILQGWNENVQDQQMITSLGGFNGQVSLTASVAPNVPDAPMVYLRPATVMVPSGGSATYVTVLTAAMTTPTGNYVVTVSARSGSITHSYQAILVVGDYRPQPQQPPPGTNATTTTQPNNGASSNGLWSLPSSSAVMNTLGSFWWLQTIVGMALVGLFFYLRRNPFRK